MLWAGTTPTATGVKVSIATEPIDGTAAIQLPVVSAGDTSFHPSLVSVTQGFLQRARRPPPETGFGPVRPSECFGAEEAAIGRERRECDAGIRHGERHTRQQDARTPGVGRYDQAAGEWGRRREGRGFDDQRGALISAAPGRIGCSGPEREYFVRARASRRTRMRVPRPGEIDGRRHRRRGGDDDGACAEGSRATRKARARNSGSLEVESSGAEEQRSAGECENAPGRPSLAQCFALPGRPRYRTGFDGFPAVGPPSR